MTSKTYFKRFLIGDFYIAGIVVILTIFSIIVFAAGDYDGAKAVVSLNGKIIYEIDLDKNLHRTEYRSGSGFNDIIVTQDGRIRFERSDCPDQVCVRTGWISRPGQVSVCLPAGIIIRIVGEEKNDGVDILLK